MTRRLTYYVAATLDGFIPVLAGAHPPLGFVPVDTVELECGTRVLTLDRRPANAPGS